MADFAQWATAAESYLGLSKGAFMAAYAGNREASNDLALEASPVAAAVISFIEAEESWIGTSSELHKELSKRVGEDVQRQKGWPKAPNTLSGLLKRLAPNLREAGVNITRLNRAGKKGSRIIQLERISNQSSESSESSDISNTQVDSFNRADDLSDGLVISDDQADDSLQSPGEENALKNALADSADDTDDLSQEFSSNALEYEPDEDELLFEAEERAAIMAESERV